jgi:hypothetical protein
VTNSPDKTKLQLNIIKMSLYSTSSDSFDEKFVAEKVINLPSPRTYRDRFNPLEQYND